MPAYCTLKRPGRTRRPRSITTITKAGARGTAVIAQANGRPNATAATTASKMTKATAHTQPSLAKPRVMWRCSHHSVMRYTPTAAATRPIAKVEATACADATAVGADPAFDLS